MSVNRLRGLWLLVGGLVIVVAPIAAVATVPEAKADTPALYNPYCGSAEAVRVRDDEFACPLSADPSGNAYSGETSDEGPTNYVFSARPGTTLNVTIVDTENPSCYFIEDPADGDCGQVDAGISEISGNSINDNGNIRLVGSEIVPGSVEYVESRPNPTAAGTPAIDNPASFEYEIAPAFTGTTALTTWIVQVEGLSFNGILPYTLTVRASPSVQPPQIPESPALAKVTAVNVANGTVKVSWARTSSSAPSRITSYLVTAKPSGNDRVPAPAAKTVSVSAAATSLNATLDGMVQDCHQVYTIGVTPIMGSTRGATAFWHQSVRPSGIVSRVPPAQVVVLLDGVLESKPGFQMDPYKPTLDGVSSYCPERWSPTRVIDGSHWSESDFAGAPKGPWSFFDKWNFDDQTSEGSTPRDLSTGAPTHSFMLDAVAARGGVVLPYSYAGASLTAGRGRADPRFVYKSYSACDSTPGCPGAPTLDTDVDRLQNEIASIHRMWPHTQIVVVGHSQGGLIAFDWWQKWWLKWGANFRRGSGHTGVYRLFSLDSPINGVCASVVCAGPPGYPSYGVRQQVDPVLLSLDERGGDAFRLLGTVGDTVPTPIGDSYGPSGDQNLQHQLLFDYPHCSDSSGITCPAPAPPDHVSDCPITSQSPSWVQQSQHFVVKFCPGDVKYFDKTLGLSY